jgi:hypothetical protein
MKWEKETTDFLEYLFVFMIRDNFTCILIEFLVGKKFHYFFISMFFLGGKNDREKKFPKGKKLPDWESNPGSRI